MWLLCVCNKLNQNILGIDFNLYTITPGLAPLIHLFLSLIINVDLSPYSTRNHICVGYPMQMKLTQKTWNLHGQNKLQHERTQHKLCSTCSCWGSYWRRRGLHWVPGDSHCVCEGFGAIPNRRSRPQCEGACILVYYRRNSLGIQCVFIR